MNFDFHVVVVKFDQERFRIENQNFPGHCFFKTSCSLSSRNVPGFPYNVVIGTTVIYEKLLQKSSACLELQFPVKSNQIKQTFIFQFQNFMQKLEAKHILWCDLTSGPKKNRIITFGMIYFHHAMQILVISFYKGLGDVE